MHLNVPRHHRTMPRREHGIAVGVAAVVLNVLASFQAVGDPEEDTGGNEVEGHYAVFLAGRRQCLFRWWVSRSVGQEEWGCVCVWM